MNPPFFNFVLFQVFGGGVEVTSGCMSCRFEKVQTDNFNILNLTFPPPTPDQEQSLNLSGSRGKQPAVEVPLERLISERFCSKTGDQDDYTCDNCGKRCGLSTTERLAEVRTGSFFPFETVCGIDEVLGHLFGRAPSLNGFSFSPYISFVLFQAPACLILSLLRYRYDANRNKKTKTFENVILPEVTQFGPDQTGPNYELTSAVVHAGIKMDSGHFYAYARHVSFRLPRVPFFDGCQGFVAATKGCR